MLEGAKEGRQVVGEQTGTVMQERKEKERKDRMLKMFEQEVIVQEPTHKPTRSRSMSKDKLSNVNTSLRHQNEILTIRV